MMRVFTSDVKVLDRTRVCVLLVLVFICSIDRSSSVDTAAETEGPVSQIIVSDELQSVPISHDEPEIRILIAEMISGRVRRSVTARNSTISFRHPNSFNPEQLNTAVTIEFNITGIDKKNRTALNAIYREVRRKILDYLNRKESTTASPTTTIVAATTAATTSATPPPPTTTIVLHSTTVTTPAITTTAALPTTITTSVVEATTDTSTNAATTTITTSVVEATTDTSTNAATTTVTIQSTTAPLPSAPTPSKRRRRRSSGGSNGNFTEDELPFVDNDLEFDENGNLIISIILDKEGVDDELLYKAIKALKESGELQAAANATVENYYRGLPPVKAAVAGFQVWLPILLAIILLLIIFILVFCCWMAKNKKKVKDDDRKKIIPPLDSKPSSSNGQAPKPRILDDNDGRIVPMDQFSEEF